MRLQLLGADVMPDSVALNMLDLSLRVHEPWLSDVRNSEQQVCICSSSSSSSILPLFQSMCFIRP